ncbi:MAG: hypothetical protein ACI8S6_003560 [Myxococcota bacterium]|jgi:hypothetical protein
MLLLILLLGMAAATPPDLTPTFPQGPAVLSAEERLLEAVRSYQTQRLAFAIIEFHQLATDGDISQIVRHEARIYLGEIHLLQDDEPEAVRNFAVVVNEDPFYQIDHFRHPPEVGALFAEVRDRILPTLSPPTAPPTIFTPVLYYPRGEWPPYERLLTSTEMLFATGATALDVYLLINRKTFQDNPEDRQRAARLRAAQLSCFTGFVGTHVARSLRARRHFRESWRTQLLLSYTPGPETYWMAGIQGEF